jgi:AcrR family transcriptional regulator
MVNPASTIDRRLALRDALIASATRIVSERGYQALRVRDLAQDVGCALGAIYNVFPDLDALIIAVKARTLDALDAEIDRRSGAVDGRGLAPRRSAIGQLAGLARTYLAFATAHPRQWQALFEHRAADTNVPQSYVEQLSRILGHIERPLAAVAPDASPAKRRLFAQALFCAVHGIVALGLDEKLGPLSGDLLSWQVEAVVQATARGLADHPELVLDGAVV